MEETLAALLHRFIDLYERDATVLDSALRFSFDVSDDAEFISETDQLSLLDRSSAAAAAEIFCKTLVRTASEVQKYKNIRDGLEREIAGTTDDGELEDWISSVERLAEMMGLPPTATFKDFDVFFAASEGLTYLEYKRKAITQRLSSKRLEAELLRFFADRILAITDAIKRLDETDFSGRIPDELTDLFRECHVNFVLGQFGTAVILCGALLEASLQDLLPSNGTLSNLIVEAKVAGLLDGWHRSAAYKIQERRNQLVHGKMSFVSVGVDWAWETVLMTRKLLADLYASRMEGAG